MNDFIHFPLHLYEGSRQYVPDLSLDIRAQFSPRTNGGLENSSVQAFVAYRDGKPVGRIAGIINRKANAKWNAKTVRFGMIDFIDDKEVSAALLDTVAEWGKAAGMDNIQGPLGVTDFDKEGMLVEDFDRSGSMVDIYNYAYYPEHLEALGFEKAVDWVHVYVTLPDKLPERYAKTARLCREMFHMHVRKLTARELKKSYIDKLFNLLNTAYAPLYGFSSFNMDQARQLVAKYINVVDLNLMPIVENDKGELLAMAVTMGSLSEAFRKAKGKLLPLGWWYLLKSLKFKHEKGADLLLIAVDPKYQGLGLNALIFEDLLPIYKEYGFEWAETGPQLEDNVKELSQWKPMNPEIIKRRRCYKKLL